MPIAFKGLEMALWHLGGALLLPLIWKRMLHKYLSCDPHVLSMLGHGRRMGIIVKKIGDNVRYY